MIEDKFQALQKKGEKLTYDQQKEKQNSEFKFKKEGINHGVTSIADKLNVFSEILGSIAQKDKTYMNILGPMAEDLKVLADLSGANSITN